MNHVIDIKVAENGRMVLPKAVRALLGVASGGVVTLTVGEDEAVLAPVEASIRKAQALYRQHVKHDLSSDEFLRQRRLEAAKEVAEQVDPLAR